MNDSLNVFIEKIAGELELKNPTTLAPDNEFRQMEEWNSMNALIILSFVNIEYRKNFTGQELNSCNTFRDIYETLQKS